MELRHIRYFLMVAEERHFTRAAARLGIGQPPLSQQIKDLEREVGAQLFRRTPHGAELTEAGSAFLSVIRDLPGTAARGALAARRVARGESGILRVGFTASSMFNSAVPAAIRTFRRAYPDVALELEEKNTRDLLDGLNSGALDAAFLRPGTAGTDRLQVRMISEEPMMIVLPESHALSDQASVHLSGLAGEEFVIFPREAGPSLYDSVTEACRDAGFEPHITQFAPQLATVLHLVAAEVGVAIVPLSMSSVRTRGVVYKTISGEAPVARIALATRVTDASATVRNFIMQTIALNGS